MGVSDVKGRAQIAVERLQLRESKRIIEWRERSERKALRDVDEKRRRLGQNAARRNHCRHPCLGIDLEIGGRLLARRSGLSVGTKLRRVVLKRAGGRRFAAGRYTLLVRRGGKVLVRRMVRAGSP